MARQDELLEIVRRARAGEYGIAPINPDKVNIDMRLYPRETMSMERAALFAEMMEQGEPFPPIWVAADGTTLIDGAHRTYANRQRGQRAMEVVVLPVEDIKDIMDLSVLANSTIAHTPLQKGDIRRILTLLLNTMSDLREEIRARYGSMEALARLWGVPTNAVVRITQSIELLRSGGVEDRSRPKEPPTRRPGGPAPEEGPWGRGEEAPTLSEQAVRTVLAVPAKIQDLPQQSPWDYLVQITLRFLRALSDLIPEDSSPREILPRVSEALMKLGKSDRDFVLHYRGRLVDFETMLSEMEE